MSLKKLHVWLLAGLIVALGGTVRTAHAASITFDLSGYTLSQTQGQFITLDNPDLGVVTGVEWSFAYVAGSAVGSASWASELSIELVAPGATPNAVLNTANNGHYPQTPANLGTFVWGTVSGPFQNPSEPLVPSAAAASFNWSNTPSITQTNSGTSNLLNNWDANGVWTLNLFDTFRDNDTNGQPAQGRFQQGSFVTINFDDGNDLTPTPVPEPATVALLTLGLTGIAVARFRRRGPSARPE